MGGKTTTSPDGPRPRHSDERNEGEGEDAGKPSTEVVEKEGAIKEETRSGNSVRDGDVRHPAGEGDDQDSRRALIAIILEFCITYLADTYIFFQARTHDWGDFQALSLGASCRDVRSMPLNTLPVRSIAVKRADYQLGCNCKAIVMPFVGKRVFLSFPHPSTPSHPQYPPDGS